MANRTATRINDAASSLMTAARNLALPIVAVAATAIAASSAQAAQSKHISISAKQGSNNTVVARVELSGIRRSDDGQCYTISQPSGLKINGGCVSVTGNKIISQGSGSNQSEVSVSGNRGYAVFYGVYTDSGFNPGLPLTVKVSVHKVGSAEATFMPQIDAPKISVSSGYVFGGNPFSVAAQASSGAPANTIVTIMQQPWSYGIANGASLSSYGPAQPVASGVGGATYAAVAPTLNPANPYFIGYRFYATENNSKSESTRASITDYTIFTSPN